MQPEIALNGLLLDYPHSGTAAYSRNLTAHLPLVAPDLRFRLYVRDTDFVAPNVLAHELQTPFAPLNRGRGVVARLDKLTWETVSWPLAAAVHHQALLHSLYLSAPPFSPAPLVVTVHDLIPLVLPDYHRSRQSAFYSRLMAMLVKRASHIITVSEHSKRDIEQVFRFPSGRIHVTYEAVDVRFRPDGSLAERERLSGIYGLPPRFVLYTGGADRRKNIETLLRAWARELSPLRSLELKLVVVAEFPAPDRLYPDTKRLTRELGLESDVVFVSSVSEDDKPALYRLAIAHCYPSLYEGFGFPPLEAMASGTPVLAARTSSLSEVVGEAGRLLPPLDIDAWAAALVEIVTSEALRQQMAAAGVAQAARFSWDQTARETADVYRQAMS